MQPFDFTGPPQKVRAELERFEAEAATKPDGYREEMELRLAYYLDRQEDDVKAALEAAFPKTHGEMIPWTIPLTGQFIREQAKVFLNGSKFELVGKDGKAIGTDQDVAKWWADALANAGLPLRLKLVDRYTTLLKTCFLKLVISDEGEISAQIWFPWLVDYVPDQADPFNLDKAWAVRLEIGSEEPSELVDDKGEKREPLKRYEFWSARDGGFYAIVTSDGEVEKVEGNPDAKNPYGVVPLVMFTAHTEELGPFVMDGKGLVLFNRAVNVALTDNEHVKTLQGFGQLVIETQANTGTPVTPVELTLGPGRAVSLPEGRSAAMLSANAAIDAATQKVLTDIRLQAMAYGIPPGSVSIEARATSSGIALQVEMRPLLEARVDSIDLYQAPVRRLWTVASALREEKPDGVTLRWEPADVQVPVDPVQDVEVRMARIKGRLSTRSRELADYLGISLDEARQRVKEIDEELAQETNPADALIPDDASAEDIVANARERASGEEPEPAPAPTGADGAPLPEGAVVQDTALNGAQVSSLLEIVTAISEGALPLATGRALIAAAFPALSEEQVTAIVSGLEGFEPPKPEPAAPPPVPPPAKDEDDDEPAE